MVAILNKPSPGKTIAQTFAPLRSIRKANSKIKKTMYVKYVIDIIKDFEEKKTKIGKGNRHPVWSEKKQAAYIVSLLLKTAPTDLLVRSEEAQYREEDNELIAEETQGIYDGTNRITALVNFKNNKFPIRIDDKTTFTFEGLPTQEQRAFLKTEMQVLVLNDCSVGYAAETASKRNEGTPMTSGEKINLTTTADTPRALALSDLTDKYKILNVDNDRAHGIKYIAQLLCALERRPHEYTTSDYRSDELRKFFAESTEPFKNVRIDDIDKALAVCQNWVTIDEETGRPLLPDDVKSIMERSTKAKASRPNCWYGAIVIGLLRTIKSGSACNFLTKPFMISQLEALAVNGMKGSIDINDVMAGQGWI